eukprot:gnl/TRDRNA2_/TRDRNA2_159310_c0_seq3.p1 gnl/TRDRNA2_/TRDRNA2_159310_c0~~gnl/TRDRNA2_/TRDRNA2_159310_c0_seq3.p1  ORF type:complete len:484 (+),score=98.57 gnl/TRDRNA2_/TRDRNA2_159310_c0_seq3:2-1453(+)
MSGTSMLPFGSAMSSPFAVGGGVLSPEMLPQALLADRVRGIQRLNPGLRMAWHECCDLYMGGMRDPSRLHPMFLQSWLEVVYQEVGVLGAPPTTVKRSDDNDWHSTNDFLIGQQASHIKQLLVDQVINLRGQSIWCRNSWQEMINAERRGSQDPKRQDVKFLQKFIMRCKSQEESQQWSFLSRIGDARVADDASDEDDYTKHPREAEPSPQEAEPESDPDDYTKYPPDPDATEDQPAELKADESTDSPIAVAVTVDPAIAETPSVWDWELPPVKEEPSDQESTQQLVPELEDIGRVEPFAELRPDDTVGFSEPTVDDKGQVPAVVHSEPIANDRAVFRQPPPPPPPRRRALRPARDAEQVAEVLAKTRQMLQGNLDGQERGDEDLPGKPSRVVLKSARRTFLEGAVKDAGEDHPVRQKLLESPDDEAGCTDSNAATFGWDGIRSGAEEVALAHGQPWRAPPPPPPSRRQKAKSAAGPSAQQGC